MALRRFQLSQAVLGSFALAACFQLCLPAWADAPKEDADDEKLQGRVVHARRLAPLDPSIEVGKKYDESRLRAPSNAKATFWWRVPDWLVGAWHNSGRTRQLAFNNLETGESYQTNGSVAVNYSEHEIIGLRKDRRGDVWTCVPTPYLSRDYVGRTLNVNVIDSVEEVESSDDHVVLRLIATTIVVDLPDRTITAISQRESLQTYKPIANGKVLVLSSMRFFDAEGKPKYATELLTHCRRQSDFTEMHYWTSPGTGLAVIDLAKSFKDFLRQQRLEDLIPERKT